MTVFKSQTNFNSGELSPRLFTRNDLEQFQNGVAKMNNMYALQHGGVTRRPGLKYVGPAANNDKRSRLIPFEFSTTQSYVLEFADSEIQFYKDQGIISDEDANTSLLLHFDGPKDSTTITDTGSTGHTLAAAGGCKISQVQKYFTGSTDSGSLYCPGSTTSFVTAPDHADWNFGAAAFTVDCALFIPTYGSIKDRNIIFSQLQDENNFYVLYFDGIREKLVFCVMVAGSRLIFEEADITFTENTWFHIALIRGWGGVVDDWAITVNGVAELTFTDNSAMPNFTGLFHIAGSAAYKDTVFDHGATGHSVDCAAVTSTLTGHPFSTYGLNFTSAGITVADDADWDIVGSNADSWTIDCWVDPGTFGPSSTTIVSQYEDANNYWYLYIDTNGDIGFRVRSGGVLIISVATTSTPASASGWMHVALCKVASEYGIYVDGVQLAYLNDTSTDTFTGSLVIGAMNSTDRLNGPMTDFRIQNSNIFSAAPNVGKTNTITIPTSSADADSNTKLLLYCDPKPFYGYIDELRVSKGVARWTAEFTPDTLPYPAQSGYTAYSLTTNVSYSESQLRDISYTQSADTMYIAHGSHAPKKLTRTGHTAWTMTTISFSDGPYDDENITAVTMTPSAVTGTITITASSATFNVTNDVGRLISLKHTNTWGVAQLITNAGNSTTVFTATVLRTFGGTGAVTTWKLGAWSIGQGYPKHVIFHENRLCFANTDTYPERIWFSKIGSYEDFGQGVSTAGVVQAITDDDGLDTELVSNQVNAIQWLYSTEQLLAGTNGGEWKIEGDVSTGITPTALRQKQQTPIGSDNVRPVDIGGTIFFLHRVGKKIFQFQYSFEDDRYVANEALLLAEHLTRTNTVKEWAYQREPNSILWSVRDDGILLGMTVNKAQKVIAWHTHETTGNIESVCTIPGAERDEVWVEVERTISGSTVRTIELMEAELSSDDSADEAFYVDSGLSYSGAAATIISGLSHLEGETVIILSGGVPVTSKTVSSGSVTLDAATTRCHIGLPYDSEIKTLPIISDDKTRGSSRGRTIRTSQVALRLYQSSDGFYVGRDSSNVETVSFPYSSSEVFSGYYTQQFDDGHKEEPQVYVKRSDAAPLTILSLTVEAQVNDR